jgi:hypothetical protein
MRAAGSTGGIGSWNDMGFEGEDQKEYARLSETLFQVINATIVEAASESFGGVA